MTARKVFPFLSLLILALSTQAADKPKPAVLPATQKTDSLVLARLFCDDMILQQKTQNAIWGWAKPGESISIEASWGSGASGQANAAGKWKLFLETPQQATGHSLTVK